MPARQDAVLARLRKICLALPEATECLTFGHPTFRVRKKSFCFYGDEGESSITVKVGVEIQPVFLKDPRFHKTHYIGKHGWVTLRPGRPDWEEITELVHSSYRLASPKKAR